MQRKMDEGEMVDDRLLWKLKMWFVCKTSVGDIDIHEGGYFGLCGGGVFWRKFPVDNGGVVFKAGGGGIFDLCGAFVVELVGVEKEDLKLMVKLAVRLVWSRLNERKYFLWRLSLMLVKREYIQCWWASLWDGNMGRFFEFAFLFG